MGRAVKSRTSRVRRVALAPARASAGPDDPRAAFFDLAPCGLLLCGPDRRVKLANARAIALCGRDPAVPVEGLALERLLGREAHALVAGREVADARVRIRRPDGSSAPVRLNAVQACGPAAEPGDIRLALWPAAEADPPRPSGSDRSSDMELIANVSHEIRTPLSGVIGVAGVLARTELTPRQTEMIELIESSGRTLERLVSDLLDLSKIEAGALTLDPQPFDLMPELRSVLDVARLRARDKGLAFAVTEDRRVLGRYLGDAVRLKQVVGNLVSNAVKFTQAGEVRVEIGVDAPGVLLIKVSDTGIGFDDAAGATLFRRFQQADAGVSRRFGGTGLGLAICKALVELMGGSIEASSMPGEGSTFTVRAPLARLSDAPPETPAAPARADEPEPGARILLVEDNPVNQRVVQLILEPYAVALTTAENGALGVEAWRAGDFDLVLMDTQMPVMDGLTAVREIRRLEREEKRPIRTPVAILSADAMDHHRREALEAGADLYIAKPVTPQSLLEGLQAALGANPPLAD